MGLSDKAPGWRFRRSKGQILGCCVGRNSNFEVAKNAAATVKRVAQELGGKSAYIILDDANLEE